MTEAEALDMAAKAAGWDDWETIQLIGRPDTRDHIRALSVPAIVEAGDGKK